MEKIKWIRQSIIDKDYTCLIDGYMLRVEQMCEGHYWWCVYYKDEQLHEPTNNFASSLNRAFGYCEGMYYAHCQTN